MKRDPLGLAVYDYWKNHVEGQIIVHSDICEDDEIAAAYLFRTVEEMPALEQRALTMAHGKTLDVGAAAGSHALALQKKGIKTTALEISENCVHVMKERGVQQVAHEDFYAFNGQKFDTVLFLMNGIGLAGTVENLPRFFKQLKSLLNIEGQALIDSSDLRYLYENEDGSFDIDLNDAYYGEVDFQMEYANVTGDWFKWLYLDLESFRMYAEMNGLNFEVVMEGENYDYLARLTLKTES